MTGKSYINLPSELKHSIKGLINIRNEDHKCFLWCHVRYLNPQEKYDQRIKMSDKKNAQELDYDGIKFSVGVKDYNKI